MALFTSMSIASSGLSAQKLNLDVIANNIANAESTRTSDGGAYRRQFVVFRPRSEQVDWKSPLLPKKLSTQLSEGVKVVRIAEDNSPLKWVYEPSHPDAIQNGDRKGWVEMPNVNVVTEMTNMIAASRAYEANLTIMNNAQDIFTTTLDIFR